MDKRIKIAIPLFFTNETNSGVVNYIVSIIAALKTLNDELKPQIVLLYLKGSPIEHVKRVAYPHITYKKFDELPRFFNYRGISRLTKFFKLNQFRDYIILRDIDIVYPYFEFNDYRLTSVKHKIHWLVDFNNIAYANHYADGGLRMSNFQKSLTERHDHIVLSSKFLFEELKSNYPYYKNEVTILNFACTIPDLNQINFLSVKQKYHLTRNYFMSPNQFWEHKNQLLVVEALNYLKKKNGTLNFDFVFTGNMQVSRGKGNIAYDLLEKIALYELTDNVKMTGVIDREDQLLLMKNCISLVQPSLYEGWSTLVEEAKALNKNIILSDLPVHREQDCLNSFYFNPKDHEDLAKKILYLNTASISTKQIDYSINVKKFGKDLIDLFIKVIKK